MAYNPQRHTAIKRAISLTSPRRIKGWGSIEITVSKQEECFECFNETGSVSCVGAVNARTRVPPHLNLYCMATTTTASHLWANIRTNSMGVKL